MLTLDFTSPVLSVCGVRAPVSVREVREVREAPTLGWLKTTPSVGVGNWLAVLPGRRLPGPLYLG